MLVNSKKILIHAMENKYAIPSTNFIDFETARTYVKVAEERKLPLVLSFAQSHSHLLSLEEAALIGKYLAEKSTTLVVLHLDHGEDIDFIRRGIELGFKSVMIDASKEDFETNIKKTKEVVQYAHENNVTVEAELGHVGANDNFEAHEVLDSIYTDVADVVVFNKRTEIDSLAVSIGTAHGVYKGVPEINFGRLEEIYKLSKIPLVLHGGSSSGDSNLERSALNGISKINIFTDFLKGAYNKINKGNPEDYLQLKEYAVEGIERVLQHYYDVFHTQSYKPIRRN